MEQALQSCLASWLKRENQEWKPHRPTKQGPKPSRGQQCNEFPNHARTSEHKDDDDNGRGRWFDGPTKSRTNTPPLPGKSADLAEARDGMKREEDGIS